MLALFYTAKTPKRKPNCKISTYLPKISKIIKKSSFSRTKGAKGSAKSQREPHSHVPCSQWKLELGKLQWFGQLAVRVRTAHILSESITVQSYRGVCKHSESGLSIHVLWLLGSMWVSSQIRGLNQALGLVGSTSWVKARSAMRKHWLSV